ncbi:lipocalin family protein [Sedimentitalea sp. HM32M-2]|uniref:lipocalin family protein n=1 Tax=Sedimentitalea sp. HM32M-2 TaxID=3351566 RepID=UPI003639D387
MRRGPLRPVLALLVGALAVSACAVPSGFRDPRAPFSASTRFDAAQMRGTWVVRARFAAADDDLGGNPERFEIGTVSGDGFAVTWHHLTCNAWECVGLTDDLVARITGPGRFTLPRGADPAAEHWVLWTDSGFRVAAIGTPNGDFGWIMTRGAVRDDLMAAAREIFEWNGYDLTRLQGVQE